MPSGLRSSRKALVDEAGKLYVLRQELAALRRQRDDLEARIARQEKRVAEAERAVDATLARATTRGSGNAAGDGDATAGEALTPGKLPHRVVAFMRRDPTRIYSATEIAAALSAKDVQQVRTALARLIDKGLARRAGAHGAFTLWRAGPSGDDGLNDAQEVGHRRVADEAEQEQKSGEIQRHLQRTRPGVQPLE